jgi:hypothetical protein
LKLKNFHGRRTIAGEVMISTPKTTLTFVKGASQTSGLGKKDATKERGLLLAGFQFHLHRVGRVETGEFAVLDAYSCDCLAVLCASF